MSVLDARLTDAAVPQRSCTCCHVSKPLTDFGHGHRNCKACVRRFNPRRGKRATTAANRRKAKVAWHARQREALSPSYVAKVMGIPPDAIPQDLLALKREQLRLQRLAKEMQQAATQEENHP